MGEQARLTPLNGAQPLPGPVRPAAQSFELVHRPSNEVLVDAVREGVQLGAVEGPVIAEPVAYLRVDLLSEAGQVRPAASPKMPGPDLLADRLPRLGTDGRGEAHEEASPAFGQATPEGIAEEVEAGVLRLPTAVRVLAEHDLRLLRVQLKTQGPEPGSDRIQQVSRLRFGDAMGNKESRRGESHPPPLAEPCGSLSAYTAPIVQPSGLRPKRQ